MSFTVYFINLIGVGLFSKCWGADVLVSRGLKVKGREIDSYVDPFTVHLMHRRSSFPISIICEIRPKCQHKSKRGHDNTNSVRMVECLPIFIFEIHMKRKIKCKEYASGYAGGCHGSQNGGPMHAREHGKTEKTGFVDDHFVGVLLRSFLRRRGRDLRLFRLSRHHFRWVF